MKDHGGCGIFICKSFPCISNIVETNCDRICTVQSEFTSFTILFISAMQAKYNPVYNMICGGDFNTYLSKNGSGHTKALLQFCLDCNPGCIYSCSNNIKFTYMSDMNKSTSIIVSKSLLLNVKNLCTIEHVDNMSDHVPLSMSLDFSIDNLMKFKGRKFKSMPKWHFATSRMIENYKNKLDSLLLLIQLPFTVLHCNDVLCTTHDIVIEALYDSIMHALLNAANSSIPFTRPY